MRSKTRTLLLILVALLFCVSITLILRPFVLGTGHTKAQISAVSAFQSQRRNHEFLTKNEKTSNELTDPLYLAMKQYNEDLVTNGQQFTDPWVFTQEALNFDNFGVEGGVIGILKIPSIGQDLPIRSGASRANLYEGVACFAQTSLPIGGENTNCVLAGHRSYEGAKLLRDIDQIAIGDEITVSNLWEDLHYTVISTDVIQRNHLEAAQIQRGRDLLTLISCHPHGSDRYRYIVVCERNSSGRRDIPVLKKVYVCAPLGTDHLEKIKRYTQYALRCGAAPVAPQFYALCLDEDTPKSQEIKFVASMSLLWFCDELWVFGDEISEQMGQEIRFCKNLNIQIRWIKDRTVNSILGSKCV